MKARWLLCVIFGHKPCHCQMNPENRGITHCARCGLTRWEGKL